ncbi:MAG: ferrous iron transporter B [Chloroflexi bacterium]|nr:ferrous iron transporter B [Chloroflexota bacterium]
MRFALVGRPNCGKSTLFNQVAGYKAETGNFHGTTVTFTESKVRVRGEVIDLVDLPGTYTLTGSNPAEAVAKDYLASNDVDVIINVIDASHLAQSLELTIELLAVKRPLILAMNMMDEALRMGLKVDGPGLEKKLGVKVVPLIASKGRGVKGLFLAGMEVFRGSQDYALRFSAVDENPLARHKMGQILAGEFVKQGARNLSWRDRLDDVLLHPIWGYVTLLLVLLSFFQAVYGIGRLIEPPLLKIFDRLIVITTGPLGLQTFWGMLVSGILQGVTAGIAIVLPYLLPFLLGLGLLEDVGYLPRVAFLMDALMHRIGLHGKAIVPFILGYGCNVPAIMSTRTLEEPRDRFMAAALATLVPCAARLAVVFGLVAYYLGPLAALGVYIFNLFVIAVTGRILTKLLPEDTPGLILEMPPYRTPTLKAVFNKAWFRIREFVVEAWPTLIAGSGVLAILSYFNLAIYFNLLIRPITWVLDLPAAVGVPLIFGILRKELSLVMLGQALGTMNFATVMTPVQLYTFTVFVMFYVPCVATLIMLRRELGTKGMLWITALTVIVALVAGLVARGMAILLL